MKIFMVMIAIFGTFIIYPSDWSKWGGPNGNFIIEDNNFNPQKINNPKILWSAEVGKGYSSVTIAGNKAYTMGYTKDKDTVFCIDVNSGKTLWSYEYESRTGEYDGPRSTPVFDNGRIYALSRIGMLNCLNAETGKVIWKIDLAKKYNVNIPTWQLASSVVVEGEMLLLNMNEYGIALNKNNGGKIWTSPDSYSGYSTPVVFDHKNMRVAAMFNGQALCLVDIKTGKKLWSYNWATSYNVNAADPLYFGNKILITSSYGKGCALLDIAGNEPKLLWESKVIASHFSSCAFINGYIYGIDDQAYDGTGRIVCVDPKNGKIIWKTGDIGKCQFIIIDSRIVIFTDMGNLYAAEAIPDGYKELARASKILRATNWTAPSYSNGKLFLRNDKGAVVCLDVGK